MLVAEEHGRAVGFASAAADRARELGGRGLEWEAEPNAVGVEL
jgi:hypothetical protein